MFEHLLKEVDQLSGILVLVFCLVRAMEGRMGQPRRSPLSLTKRAVTTLLILGAPLLLNLDDDFEGKGGNGYRMLRDL